MKVYYYEAAKKATTTQVGGGGLEGELCCVGNNINETKYRPALITLRSANQPRTLTAMVAFHDGGDNVSPTCLRQVEVDSVKKVRRVLSQEENMALTMSLEKVK